MRAVSVYGVCVSVYVVYTGCVCVVCVCVSVYVVYTGCVCPPGLLYVGFSACMFGLYSFMPVVIKKTSATSVNLSLLTADLYTLFCGLFLFHYKVS